MSESPAAASPYEVLDVTPSASDEELRRAYRRLLRRTHPDVGGSAAQFHAVQVAWERVGNPDRRADYDRRRYPDTTEQPVHTTARASGPATRTGPKARMYGHPGGLARQRYLELLREWAGRGTTIEDAFAPDLVRSAPREIRHCLAKALAEEATAQQISGLGIGFTAWHDVAAGSNVDKVDHVVLGPAGLFGVLSEDWGSPVQLRRGELVGEALHDEDHPVSEFTDAARALAKSLRIRFTAIIIVLPDDSVSEPLTVPGRGRRPTMITVPRSRLVGLLREGLPGVERGSFEKVFEVRSRLQDGIRLIAD
ncbi:DnaJ domain-containing protein [Cryobacterium sp. PH31-AA6]|uniref:DnaJ domain-containing protein n=1 Tax=Cryobacterium sp. PH31-AA6 TaxID=3046205 RepID=UPI0024BBC684|nr:DnaJ domain-containing protein [Cryobacterium sp. PH31-AA6]MDJ0322718.1 DnaJ domain-containing protein [Cryobacterium sp. PH31-AA6]